MEDFKIVDFGCKVNETQSFTRKNSEISSSRERYILPFDVFSLIQPKTDPSKSLGALVVFTFARSFFFKVYSVAPEKKKTLPV